MDVHAMDSKECLRMSQMTHQGEAYPGFYSMK